MTDTHSEMVWTMSILPLQKSKNQKPGLLWLYVASRHNLIKSGSFRIQKEPQTNSLIEFIEATIKIIDVEMGKAPEYLTGGKTPLERVHKLLSKLHSIGVCKDKGSLVSKNVEALLNKFIQPVESIFKNLPRPLKWQSFLMNDLNLLTDIPLIVQKESEKHDLNKAKI